MKKLIVILGIALLLPSISQAREHCREYNTIIKINGRNENAYGVSCLQPDGSWKIKNDEVFLERNDRPVYIQTEPLYVQPSTTYTTPRVISNTVYIRDTYPVVVGHYGNYRHSCGRRCHYNRSHRAAHKSHNYRSVHQSRHHSYHRPYYRGNSGGSFYISW